jgi:hypothetical protein
MCLICWVRRSRCPALRPHDCLVASVELAAAPPPGRAQPHVYSSLQHFVQIWPSVSTARGERPAEKRSTNRLKQRDSGDRGRDCGRTLRTS